MFFLGDALEEAIKGAQSPQQQENLNYELRALEAFERSLTALEMGGLNFEHAAPRRLEIEGVTVSVRPRLHIRVSRMRGSDLFGAVLIDVAKGTEPKSDEAKSKLKNGMAHSAILLHQHLVETRAAEEGKASPEHCFIFHSHRQERVCAPTNYRRAYRNIEAVCRNIARSWDGITPPANFQKASYLPELNWPTAACPKFRKSARGWTMSRSQRQTKVFAMTSAKSDKTYKVAEHRASDGLRAFCCPRIRTFPAGKLLVIHGLASVMASAIGPMLPLKT